MFKNNDTIIRQVDILVESNFMNGECQGQCAAGRSCGFMRYYCPLRADTLQWIILHGALFARLNTPLRSTFS